MSSIDIENPSREFEEHLQVDNNYRIILSGKFGIGKTYFLNNFFGKRTDRYNKFLISPVNYVINSNEDIFELIKADIIKELFLTGKINLEKLPEDSTLQKISNFVDDKRAVLGKFMLNLISKLSSTSPVPEMAIEAISKIYKDYKSHSKRKKSEDKTMSEELFDFLDATNEKIGHIYEHNYITKVIDTFLEQLKENGKKRNVLIIDDLDRVDPEHIFRILNVLSAHNNQFDSTNKFSFDHIVVVCDIANIKKIFYHKYGRNVDFEGYIDKFYSTHIFDFLNADALAIYVEENFGSDRGEVEFFTFILRGLVESNLLTVRKLLKHKINFSINRTTLFVKQQIDSNIPFRGTRPNFIGNPENYYFDSDDLVVLRFFKLMSIIYGSFDDFYDSLRNLKESINTSYDYADCRDIVAFLAFQEHLATKKGDELFFYKRFDSRADSGYKVITGIDYPITVSFNQHFRIIPKWNNENKYESTDSYFKGSKIIEIERTEYSNGKSGKLIKGKDFIDKLDNIINSCQTNKYLNKVGIVFNKPTV